MEITHVTSEDGNTAPLKAILKGKVFHVTSFSAYKAIRRSGKILHNKDTRFELNTTSDNSFGRLMGHVCFLNLQGHTDEIMERIHCDYPYSRPPWFETRRKGWIISNIAYLVLSPSYYDRLIPNRAVHDHYHRTGKYLHWVPHAEVWIHDHVPLDWIQTLIVSKSRTPAPAANSMAGIVEAAIKRIGKRRR
jgi:hypothetical protein